MNNGLESVTNLTSCLALDIVVADAAIRDRVKIVVLKKDKLAHKGGSMSPENEFESSGEMVFVWMHQDIYKERISYPSKQDEINLVKG